MSTHHTPYERYAMLLNRRLEVPKFCLLSETDTDSLPVGTKMMTLRGVTVTKKEEGWLHRAAPMIECRMMLPIAEYNPFVILSTPKGSRYLVFSEED